MGLLGRHTQRPQGDPANMSSMDTMLRSGDTAGLQRIAQGGVYTLPGSRNQNENWGGSGSNRVAERAYAAALLAGDPANAEGVRQRAVSGTRQWTGGLIANALPTILAAAGTAVGLPPALTGAVTGGLSRAAGLTRGSTLGGAVGGAAQGALGGLAARGLAGGGLAGAARVLGIPTTATGVLGAAQQRIAGGGGGGAGGILGTGLSPQDVLGGVAAYQGAQREGQANQLRERGLASLQQPGPGPDLSAVYADPGNPYQRRPVNTALQAARASLRGY